MFEKPYIRLENKKKIRVKKLEIELSSIENDDTAIAIIHLNPIYMGYFNSQSTTIRSIFYKGLFKKSRELNLSTEAVPSFIIRDGELIISQELERI